LGPFTRYLETYPKNIVPLRGGGTANDGDDGRESTEGANTTDLAVKGKKRVVLVLNFRFSFLM
jgi:hypothetical protein